MTDTGCCSTSPTTMSRGASGANANLLAGLRPAQSLTGLAGWVEVWEKTRRSAELADEWNLDRKQVILNLFSALHEAA